MTEKSVTKLMTCHKDLVAVMQAADRNSPPCKFGISYGHRTVEEQQELFAKGRTAPGKIVTYCDGIKNPSKHNASPAMAVDVFCLDQAGKVTWADSYYKSLAVHILAIATHLYKRGEITHPIVWGGHFTKLKDLPHFELKG